MNQRNHYQGIGNDTAAQKVGRDQPVELSLVNDYGRVVDAISA
jgi:hypothetical protein